MMIGTTKRDPSVIRRICTKGNSVISSSRVDKVTNTVNIDNNLKTNHAISASANNNDFASTPLETCFRRITQIRDGRTNSI